MLKRKGSILAKEKVGGQRVMAIEKKRNIQGKGKKESKEGRGDWWH